MEFLLTYLDSLLITSCLPDVIIVEDEPYYFLYADPWVPQAGKANGQALRAYDNFKDEKKGVEEFFKKLPPSYLKFDYQGRVIRLDTFSKTLAPGSRLGWFTTSPLL
jgi:aromatic amino acid aminotransferase I